MIEAALAAFLFATAYAVAVWYVPQFVASGGKPWFYQQEFGAAAMQACGLGYVNPDPAATPALSAFLDLATDEVSCAELQSVPTRPLTGMQRAFRYLMLTVGTTWRLQGRVAWSELLPLYGLLYGSTIVLAFAIFRQAMGRTLASIAAFALMTSTLHLNNLPHLRDYAKAPFVLALVLIVLRLVLKPVSLRRTLVWAVAAGGLTGIGIGFRNDLLVAIPAFIGVLAVFLPGDVRQQLGMRAAAIALYLVTVYAAMWPMSSIYTTGGGSSTQHLVLLGLTPAFSASLGVDNSQLYQLGFEYRDELALAVIDNYSDRRLGEHRFLEMYGADYDRAATRVLTDFATEFPADLLTRVYASAIRMTELPHLESTAAVVIPAFVRGLPQRLLHARLDILRRVQSLWPWPLVFTLLVLSVISLRLGAFATLFVFYLSGYPALQFQERHFFHLEFVGWLALGFACAAFGRGVHAAISAERRLQWQQAVRPANGWTAATLQAAAMWTVLAVTIVAPLWLLRRYQAEHVRGLLTAIATAPQTARDVSQVPLGNAIRFETRQLVSELPSDPGVHAAYVAAEIGREACDAMYVDVTQRYQAMSKGYDFSHTSRIAVPIANEPVRVFFPAYFRNPASTRPVDDGFRFAGLEMTAANANCLGRIATINEPARYSSLLDLQLPPDWERATPYATISGVEHRENPSRAYTFPDPLSRHFVQRMVGKSLVSLTPGEVLNVAPTFVMKGAEWRVDGAGGVGGRGPLMYLAEMKPRRMEKGEVFVAEGTIEKGGVTFGLVRDSQWIVQLHIVETGDFAVVIVVPESADGYKLIFANNLRGMSLVNRVVVRRSGFVMASEAR